MINLRYLLFGLGTWVLIACLFDKPKEEVILTLSNVPKDTERIRIVAVEKSDTAKVLGELHSQAWSGKPIHFDLGLAQDKDCFLRVEGYQDTFLVYLSLVPPGKNSSDPIFYPNVNSNWPAVVIMDLVRDSAKIDITCEFRNAPAGSHWVLAPNSPLRGGAVRPGEKTLEAIGATFQLGVLGLLPGTFIIATIHDDVTKKALPVQLPDTILTDEALAPAGSSVSILGTERIGDSVEILLEMKNFAMPTRDEPAPGRGWPKVHDARGLRQITGFHVKDGDFTRLIGPVWELDGVTTLVVALHYADGTRVRPLVAASVSVATALLVRDSLPNLKIISNKIIGTSLQLVIESKNFTGQIHYHVFKDNLNSEDYQLCRTNTCLIDPSVWTGAKQLIAAVVNEDHSLFLPQSKDSLIAPF